MDVTLAAERLFVLEERLTVEEIQQRAMDKPLQAFGGGLGALLQRPKHEEISLVAKQRRLEPFWHVAGRAVYVYERTRDYMVSASAPDVEAITINGMKYEGQSGEPSSAPFELARASIAGRSSRTSRTSTGLPVPRCPMLQL